MTIARAPSTHDLDGLVARVIDLAVGNAAAGQLPFAALVVRDGEVLATGVNTTRSSGDVTEHAEVEAVRAASRLVGPDLRGAIVVSSCEPCAMCHAVCVAAGIERVYFAAPRDMVPDLGAPDRPDMSRLQHAVQASTPAYAQQVPSPRARAPFDLFVDVRRRADAGSRR
jgi:tRNA(Arg) A34 adenosine deaminase TadA